MLDFYGIDYDLKQLYSGKLELAEQMVDDRKFNHDNLKYISNTISDNYEVLLSLLETIDDNKFIIPDTNHQCRASKCKENAFESWFCKSCKPCCIVKECDEQTNTNYCDRH
jgi:hypothetical protein